MTDLRQIVLEAARKALAEHLPNKHRQKDHAGGGTSSPSVSDSSPPTKGAASSSVQWGGRAEEIAKAKTGPGGMHNETVARSAYEGTFAGFETKVNSVFSIASKTTVSGKITKDGVYAGHFARTIQGNTAEHDVLELLDKHQGSGFAREFNRNAENHYIANGIKQVKLYADISVGGYAWARQGFDFASKNDLKNVQKRIISRVRGDVKRRTSPDELEAFSKRVESATHSWELASAVITTRDGVVHDIGKQAMLGSKWSGVKHLQPGDSTYEIGEVSYQQKKGKK